MHTILSLLLLLLLASCGPKDIAGVGEDSDRQLSSVSHAEQMRYPIYGQDANQKMLYQNNCMNTMVYRQYLINNALKASQYDMEAEKQRAKPKQASPFLE
ncbi:MAG: chemotaxis protein [Desulfovibrio sp.]|nr:chemotaxis protein [Desulfovibrio sp.]